MFKHLLLATDGSAHAESAVKTGVQLARSLHAEVTGMTVLAPDDAPTPQPTATHPTAHPHGHGIANAHLRFVQIVANTHDVTCDTLCVTGEAPHEEIIRTADRLHCDLIVMGAFGHKGIKAKLLGSETQRVLIHGHLPVLVCK